MSEKPGLTQASEAGRVCPRFFAVTKLVPTANAGARCLPEMSLTFSLPGDPANQACHSSLIMSSVGLGRNVLYATLLI